MTDTAAISHNLSGPLLMLIRGLPGSGKTYLANVLGAALGPDKVVLLDPDATDYTAQDYLDFSASLTAEGVDEKFHPYRFLRRQAHQAILDHKVIIWNQPFTHLDGFQKTVANLEGFATEHDTPLPTLVVEIQADPALAKQRVDRRKQQGGHGPSDDTFARFVNDYESFERYGYTTVSVSGHDDVQASAQTCLQALDRL